MPGPHDPGTFAGRMAEIERRLSALERQPMSTDMPFTFTPYQDLLVTGGAGARSIPIYTGGGTGWVLCYTVQFPICIYPGVYMQLTVEVPAGVVAEVRLINGVAGGRVSGAYSVGAGVLDVEFRWAHGQQLGTGPFKPGIEARIVSGTSATPAEVYVPDGPLLVTQQSINVLGGYTVDGRI